MDFEITTARNTSHASRQARYRENHPEYSGNDALRKRQKYQESIPEFVGIDTEGVVSHGVHIAALLGVGTDHYVARDKRRGLQWKEVFEFLYAKFELNPKAIYIGFYLGYDFNFWLQSLPEKAAWKLLTKEGIASRRYKGEAAKMQRNKLRPVRCDGWEIDMLGFKQLKIRPRVCDCLEKQVKCEHKRKRWMHISDCGPFFQMSFLKLLTKWQAIRDEEEFRLVKEGKDSLRVDATWKDIPKLKKYNGLENVILARAMTGMATQLKELEISPSPTAWYGPGSLANIYLRQQGIPTRYDIEEWGNFTDFMDTCRKSYYGGWFEIFSHGIIHGKSWNYDINSAYPNTIAKLPHICEHCACTSGNGRYKGRGRYVLLYATVRAAGNKIGPVPYRNSHGAILRPSTVRGWYWKDEIDAGIRAGIIDRKTGIDYHGWQEFLPCSNDRPLSGVADLYRKRAEIRATDKDHPMGMAIKLLINSLYGKFAQSEGAAIFKNWFYASYITSQCRTQILDSIASHPKGVSSVLMVATDGICFDQRHPKLPVSKELGDWEESEYTDLCLFKPGVYWHNDGKEVVSKTRGAPAAAFEAAIPEIEKRFEWFHEMRMSPKRYLEGDEWQWPKFDLVINFKLKSCKQALNEHDWTRAARVDTMETLEQNSDPVRKRGKYRYNDWKERITSEIKTTDPDQIETVYYKDIQMPEHPSHGFTPEFNDAFEQFREIGEMLRDKEFTDHELESE